MSTSRVQVRTCRAPHPLGRKGIERYIGQTHDVSLGVTRGQVETGPVLRIDEAGGADAVRDALRRAGDLGWDADYCRECKHVSLWREAAPAPASRA
jgi:hypothetical protein